MSKRLLSTDKRTEAILDYMKKNNVNTNISGYICGSVLDEFLPVYSSLRLDALYLLDYVVNGKEWHANKLDKEYDDNEKNYIIRQTLGRSVSWLKRNHHIKKGSVIRDIVLCFCESSLCGGVALNDLDNNVRRDIEDVKLKLKEADNDYTYNYVGLGNLALDILERWDKLWECDKAYDLIISVIYCENMKFAIDPFEAIKMVQNVENQFIIEAIGEK